MIYPLFDLRFSQAVISVETVAVPGAAIGQCATQYVDCLELSTPQICCLKLIKRLPAFEKKIARLYDVFCSVRGDSGIRKCAQYST